MDGDASLGRWCWLAGCAVSVGFWVLVLCDLAVVSHFVPLEGLAAGEVGRFVCSDGG